LRLIIHAPFIHKGGGKELLAIFLEALRKHSGAWSQILSIFDIRFQGIPDLNFSPVELTRTKPTLLSRLKAEWILSFHAKTNDLVLCFGNLPPFFPTKGRIVVFVQNTHVLAPEYRFHFTLGRKLTGAIQQKWLRLTKQRVWAFIVQTPTMKEKLVSQLNLTQERVTVFPFWKPLQHSATPSSRLSGRKWDFGYISLPRPHKNHERLVEAFILLAKERLYPSLVVTVPNSMNSHLAKWIEEMKDQYSLNITNLSYVERDEISHVYRQMNAFIFPSLTESFGIPLLEAEEHGLPILAGELDYVRDVVNPVETFNPESPRSIMRAVRRFLKQPKDPVSPSTSEDFVQRLLQMARQSSLIP